MDIDQPKKNKDKEKRMCTTGFKFTNCYVFIYLNLEVVRCVEIQASCLM